MRFTEIEIKKHTKEDCDSGQTCQLYSPDTDHVNYEPVGLEAAKHQGVEVRKIGRLELAAAKIIKVRMKLLRNSVEVGLAYLGKLHSVFYKKLDFEPGSVS